MRKEHIQKTAALAGFMAFLVMALIFLSALFPASRAEGVTFSSKGNKEHLPVEFSTSIFEPSSEPGAKIIVLRLTPAKGQYAYANDPGEAIGRPTTVSLEFEDLSLTPNFTIVYPLGKQIADIYSGGKQVNVYDETVPIYIYIPSLNGRAVNNSGGGAKEADLKVNLKVTLLICSIQNCTPVNRTLPVEIRAGTSFPDAEKEAWWADFSESLSIIQNTMPCMVPVYDSPGLEIEGLGKALVFGIIAGLILNFMPCVFPVVSLKLLSFIITLGQPDSEKRLRAFRYQNLMFALGVIVWFTILSGVLSTMDLLWGQMFQSQVMVIIMLVLVFALTLSLFGLFMLPSFAFREKQGRRVTKRSAFITGMLATCLATPCSGPLLGGVLGWSFNQPQPILGIVFLAVGLGMASPYLLLAAFPSLARYFPKPGPWLAKLEVVLGFFLLLTCAYLFSLLTGEGRAMAAAALGLVFISGWVWGRRQNKKGMEGIFYWRWLTGCIAALAALLAVWNFMLFDDDKAQWVPYSEEAFLAARTNSNIVIDFTANWCPNCKLLERTVFTEERIQDWQNRYNVVFMQIDLTHDNPEGYAFLEALNSNSIPVVALFPQQTGESTELNPIVLRDLFGPDRLEEAAKKAWGAP